MDKEGLREISDTRKSQLAVHALEWKVTNYQSLYMAVFLIELSSWGVYEWKIPKSHAMSEIKMNNDSHLQYYITAPTGLNRKSPLWGTKVCLNFSFLSRSCRAYY